MWESSEGDFGKLRGATEEHLWWSKHDPQNNVKSGEFYVILKKKSNVGEQREAAGEPRRSVQECVPIAVGSIT